MIGEKIAILDLGSYKIKLLIISLDKNNYIEIHAKYSIFSSGIKKGEVTDVHKLKSQIRQCIEYIEREIKINIKDIYVGISSTNCNFVTFGISRNIGSYEIEEKKDLQNLINLATSTFYQHYPNDKIIHFLNSGFYLDKKKYVENPVGLKSKTLDVNFSFISFDKNIISNYIKVFDDIGVKVNKFFHSSFASSILSADQEVLEKGFINIDFGYDKTCVNIFENSKLFYSSTIPIGSFHINNDLIKSIDIDKNLSEKIKCNFDNIIIGKINDLIDSEIRKKRISTDIIIKIVNARIDEIIEYIYKNIKFCNSINKASRKIIITGGGSDLLSFRTKLSKKINVPVDYAKQSFPIKNTEFNIFTDFIVCLGIAKLIYYPIKDEIKSYDVKPKGFFNKFYSLFLK